MEGTGKKLRHIAEKHGYSIKDIQNYLGLACPQAIYRWYKGQAIPTVDHLLSLSCLYHVHMEELVATEQEVCPFRYGYLLLWKEEKRGMRLIRIYRERISGQAMQIV